MATPSSILAWRNSMSRGAWGATAHRVAKSWTRLGDQTHSTQGQHYPAFHQWEKKKWNWNPVTSESLLSVFFFFWSVLVAARFQHPWLQSSLISTVQCWPRVMHVVTMPYILGWLKSLPETWIRSLAWEDPLEKEMATHSRALAWQIPWMEEPSRLQPRGSQRVGHH